MKANKTKPSRLSRWRSVPCRSCGAKVGGWCKTEANTLMPTSVHTSREEDSGAPRRPRKTKAKVLIATKPEVDCRSRIARKAWKKRKRKQKLEQVLRQEHTNTAQKVRAYLSTNPEQADAALLSTVRGHQPLAPTQGPAAAINYKDMLITCRSVEETAALIWLLAQ